MHILSIDPGSYSLKLVEAVLEKKKLRYLDKKEIILPSSSSSSEDQREETERLSEIRFDFIQRYLKTEGQKDVGIIMPLPVEMLSSRHLSLPIKNRRKAFQAIPFQLEDTVPLTGNDLLWDAQLNQKGGLTETQVFICSRQEFEKYYEQLQKRNINLELLTAQGSAFEVFCHIKELHEHICILDIGHQTTKAYFLRDGNLLSSHVSYVAGKSIDEAIAGNYNISLDEAVVYKHKTAFFLTEDQKKTSDESQKDFGQMMEDVFAPIISEFKRWNLGHRVTHGGRIEKILVCGGTSNIEHICPFLSEQLDFPVEEFPGFQTQDVSGPEWDMVNRKKFHLCHMMAFGQQRRSRFINFLKGDYSSGPGEGLPLYSLSFVATRALMVACLIAVVFAAEGLILNLKNTALEKKINQAATELGLTTIEKISLKKNPRSVLPALEKKEQVVAQSVSLIQAQSGPSALTPIADLSRLLGPTKPIMSSFSSNDRGSAQMSFRADSLELLEDLQQQIQSLSLPEASFELDPNAMQLDFSYQFGKTKASL